MEYNAKGASKEKDISHVDSLTSRVQESKEIVNTDALATKSNLVCLNNNVQQKFLKAQESSIESSLVSGFLEDEEGPSLQRSSQVSLCQNVGKMNMGGKRGRPRTKVRLIKNPFDLGFNKKKFGCGIVKRKFTESKSKAKAKHGTKIVSSLEGDLLQSNKIHQEVDGILECAENLGLSVVNNITDSKKVIGEMLNRGDV